MNSLLDRADEALTGSLDVSGHSLRVACWFARAALEQSVSELLATSGLDPGSSTMRSRPSCLEVRFGTTDPALAADAAYAWAELSRASHHHAFRLTPTIGEVRHLVDVVGRIAQRCDHEAAFETR